MKRMICYRRVSTADQADQGYSLSSQLKAITAYAASCGLEIVADFADDCSGATPMADRPEGRKAMAALKRQEADGIIAHRIDRLSRALVDAVATVRDLTRAGLEVHSLDIGRISTETDIVLVLQAWQGSAERKKILEHPSQGRPQKAKTGLVVGTGRPPYGYNYQAGQFVIEKAQATIVRLIYQWCGYGDEFGRTLKLVDIRNRLLELGIQPPYAQRSESGEWSAETIRRILASETYLGVWRYGKKIGDADQGGQRELAEQVAVSLPPIVDWELWQAVRARRTL